MVKKEIIIINNIEYCRTYSDAGFYIEREGVQYSEAVDPINSNREYTETTEPIEIEDDLTEIEEKALGYDILIGG